jgi:hypothetical protein
MPFIETQESEQIYIRDFSQEVDSTEFVWHRDDEDRMVVSVESTDWQIQLENKLPQSLNTPVFIARGEWHRVIKGTGELRIKIVKSYEFDK